MFRDSYDMAAELDFLPRSNLSIEVRIEQKVAEIANCKKREEERKQAYIDWSKPENIEKRMQDYLDKAEEALARGKELSYSIRSELGIALSDPDLPDPLPEHLKGQSPSTIRAMLRHETEPDEFRPTLSL